LRYSLVVVVVVVVVVADNLNKNHFSNTTAFRLIDLMKLKGVYAKYNYLS